MTRSLCDNSPLQQEDANENILSEQYPHLLNREYDKKKKKTDRCQSDEINGHVVRPSCTEMHVVAHIATRYRSNKGRQNLQI